MMPHRVALAATVLLLTGLASISYEVALDGTESTYTGFPLPWHSRVPGFSMATEIYLVPLTVNLLCYWWAARSAGRILERLPARVARVVTGALICAGAATALLGLTIACLHDVFLSGWPEPGTFTVTAVRYGALW